MKNKISLFIMILISLIINIPSCGLLSDLINGDPKVDPPIEVDKSPDTPVNVQATDGGYSNKIIVTWDIVDNTTGYKIYRAGSLSIYDFYSFVSSETTNFYFDEDVLGGIIYYYKVKAINDTYESSLSRYDTGYIDYTPSAPFNVSASAYFAYDWVQITWEWDDSAINNADYSSTPSYDVYSSDYSNGPYRKIGSAFGVNYFYYFIDTDFYFWATTFYYKVKVIQNGNESGFSEIASYYFVGTF